MIHREKPPLILTPEISRLFFLECGRVHTLTFRFNAKIPELLRLPLFRKTDAEFTTDYARMLSAKNRRAPRHFRGDMPPKRISFISHNLVTYFKIVIHHDITLEIQHQRSQSKFCVFSKNNSENFSFMKTARLACSLGNSWRPKKENWRKTMLSQSLLSALLAL